MFWLLLHFHPAARGRSTYPAWLSPQTVTLYQTHLSMWRLSRAVDKEKDSVDTRIDCFWKPANRHVWRQLNHLVFRERELGLNGTQLIVISEKRIMCMMSISNPSEPGKTTLSIKQSQGRDNGGKLERSSVIRKSHGWQAKHTHFFLFRVCAPVTWIIYF